MVSYDRDLRGRTHYYTREEIAPDNENEVYFIATAFTRTLDGGHTVAKLAQESGGDNHEMWIDPTNGDRMAVASDEDLSISVNRGRTWNHIQLAIAQMYHVTVDDQIPYNVYGNRQDGYSYRGPSNSLQMDTGDFSGGAGVVSDFTGGVGVISRGVWQVLGGGESGFATPDPVDNNFIWNTGTGFGSVGGAVFVFDERNLQAREVDVWPEITVGAYAAQVKYRFNWEFPLTISPHDHKKVYVGSQFVHVTTDAGNSWQIISPDLTRNDKSRQQISGGLTPDNIGVEYAGVVFAIAESPKEAGVIWAGTNDGLVQITRDGGRNWTNLTANIPGLPEWGTVSSIQASRYDAGKAYITVDFHQMNNRDPFVYKTTDYGKTWTAITGGIPHSMLSYAHCIREDPVRPGMLFLGTENALYLSFDDGKNWQPLQNNLPHAPVYWIAAQERFHDLVLATYGRGFWILDDLTPLEQMTPEIAESNAYLFTPRDAYRFRYFTGPAAVNYDPTTGKNPPYGASISYYLKSAPKEDVKIVVQDASGKTVRTLTGKKEVGINRIWWNLRFEPTKEIRLRTSPIGAPDVTVGPEGWRAAPGVSRVALLAPPGTYTLKMTVGGKDWSQKLNVLMDPHSAGTEADIQTQNKLMTVIADETNSMAECVNQIESLRVQLSTLVGHLEDGDNSKAIRTAADALAAKFVELEKNLLRLQVTGKGPDIVRWTPALLDKLGYLAGQVSGSDSPPTTQEVALNDELSQQAAKIRADLDGIVATELAAFNAILREKNVPNIISKAP